MPASVLGEAVVRFKSDAKGLVAGLQKARDTVSGTARGIGGFTNRLSEASTSLGILGGAIVAPFAAGLKGAMDFDKAFAEVTTLIDGASQKEFGDLKEGIQDVSLALGEDLVTSTKAVYQAISAGVPRENVLDFLRTAGEAAIGGVTDTETAVDALTTVVNAYGMEATDATKVSDILFEAVKAGKTTFGELSASIGNVASVAASGGVSLEELAASLAAVTKRGINTAEAVTAINSLVLNLIKPTDDSKKAMMEAGIEIEKFQQGAISFGDIMKQIAEKTKGSTVETTKLISEKRALKAAIALTSDGLEEYTGILDGMYTSMGNTSKAAEKMQTDAKRIADAWNALKITLQQVAVPILEDLAKLADKATTGMRKLNEVAKEHPRTWGLAMKGVSRFGAAVLALAGLGKIAQFLKGGLGAIGIGAAFKGATGWVLKFVTGTKAVTQVAAPAVVSAGASINAALGMGSGGTAAAATTATTAVAGLGATMTALAGTLATVGVAITTLSVVNLVRTTKAFWDLIGSGKALDESIEKTARGLEKRGVIIDREALKEMDRAAQMQELYRLTAEHRSSLIARELEDLKQAYATEEELRQAERLGMVLNLTEREAAAVALAELGKDEIERLEEMEEKKKELRVAEIVAEQTLTSQRRMTHGERAALIQQEFESRQWAAASEQEIADAVDIMEAHSIEVRKAAVLARINATDEEIAKVKEGLEVEELATFRKMELQQMETGDLQQQTEVKKATVEGYLRAVEAQVEEVAAHRSRLVQEIKNLDGTETASLRAKGVAYIESGKLLDGLNKERIKSNEVLVEMEADRLAKEVGLDRERLETKKDTADRIKDVDKELVEANRETIEKIVTQNGELFEAYKKLPQEQRTSVDAMIANMIRFGADGGKILDELRQRFFDIDPRRGSPSPAGEIRKGYRTIEVSQRDLVTATANSLHQMRLSWVRHHEHQRQIAMRIAEAQRQVDPYAPGSPSLVDQVASGTAEMVEHWKRMARNIVTHYEFFRKTLRDKGITVRDIFGRGTGRLLEDIKEPVTIVMAHLKAQYLELLRTIGQAAREAVPQPAGVLAAAGGAPTAAALIMGGEAAVTTAARVYGPEGVRPYGTGAATFAGDQITINIGEVNDEAMVQALVEEILARKRLLSMRR